MNQYDLVVIGGGSAGLTAATVGGRVGARTLLVDKERLGGDCLYYGCVPSKAFIRAARAAHDQRNAERFGLQTKDFKADIQAVLGYVWDTVERISNHDSPERLGEHGVEVAFGGAEFVAPDRIRIGGDREVTSRRTIIAVGSHAKAPPIPGLAEAGYLDHVRIFHLEALPQRLAVIGGGPIGLELGQSMARLGSQVTVLQADDHILPRDDEDLTDALLQLLSKELTVHTGARVTRVSTGDGVKRVHCKRGERELTVEADEILVALGRAPTLEGLALEQAGVETNATGIVVDSTLRTSQRHIWAAGDCAGGPQFTHYAEAQARLAARNALFRGRSRFDDQGTPWTTFTDPELAHVGMTEATARLAGRKFDVYRFEYGDLDRAITEGEPHGTAKVVCANNGKVLGASLLGPQAGESIGELVLAMKFGISLDKLASTIHVYPSMNRIVRRLGDQRFLEKGVSRFVRSVFGNYEGNASA